MSHWLKKVNHKNSTPLNFINIMFHLFLHLVIPATDLSEQVQHYVRTSLNYLPYLAVKTKSDISSW